MEEHLNQYGLYPASYCRALGLPMYDKESYEAVAEIYLSRTRCQSIRRPVEAGEEPVAFYRCQHGNTPLYYRGEAVTRG